MHSLDGGRRHCEGLPCQIVIRVLEGSHRQAWETCLDIVRVTETTWSCMENQSSVTDRTWLKLMCCAPSRPWCPNFRVCRYKVGAGVNLELKEQGNQGY